MWHVGFMLYQILIFPYKLNVISEVIVAYISKYFSIIHKGKSPKSSIKVNWAKPLDYDGQDLYLRYSIVMEKSQYWVGLAYPPKLETDSEIDQFETSGWLICSQITSCQTFQIEAIQQYMCLTNIIESNIRMIKYTTSFDKL